MVVAAVDLACQVLPAMLRAGKEQIVDVTSAAAHLRPARRLVSGLQGRLQRTQRPTLS